MKTNFIKKRNSKLLRAEPVHPTPCGKTTYLAMSLADTRRLVSSERSRTEWLEKRRAPDPAIQNIAQQEPFHCRRIAGAIFKAMRRPE
jgi:hypothetical protein